MARVGDPAELARVLAGEWHIRGSNYWYWRTGLRLNPTVEFELTQGSPLQLHETYRYFRKDKGHREFEATSNWKGSHFSWVNFGEPEMQAAFVVNDTPASPDVVALHVSHNDVDGGSVTILSRSTVPVDQVRALVSRDTYNFELSAEEYWQLTWLTPHDVT